MEDEQDCLGGAGFNEASITKDPGGSAPYSRTGLKHYFTSMKAPREYSA